MKDTVSTPLVTKEGSLGLLATGYIGLVAWRKARNTDNQTERDQHEG